MNLVVDIGNNFFKLGIFENSNLVFSFFEKNDKIDAEIEKIIRDQASAITKELEGNPSPNEKISDKKEEE